MIRDLAPEDAARDPLLVIDMHAHLFNADDLPVRGFLREVVFRRLGPLAGLLAGAIGRFADRAPTYEEDLAALDRPRRLLRETRRRPDHWWAKLSRLVHMSVVATHSRLELLARADAVCRGRPGEAHPGASIIVSLCVDLEGPCKDVARATPQQQFDFQERLFRASVRGNAPGTSAIVLPFVGYDPTRPDGDPRNDLRLVQDHVRHRGAIGVKLYPALGFFPLGNGPGGSVDGDVDRRLVELYQWCEREQVPITAHCSPANTTATSEGMAQPRNWRPVLDRFPGLRLNLAHVGGIGAGGWLDEAAVIVTEYGRAGGHVYADCGNHDLVSHGHVLENDGGRREESYFDALARLFADTRTELLRDRIMFGTDHWFLLMHRDADRFLEEYTTTMLERFGPDTYRRFAGRAALEFLGLDDAANANRRRVVERFAELQREGAFTPPDSWRRVFGG